MADSSEHILRSRTLVRCAFAALVIATTACARQAVTKDPGFGGDPEHDPQSFVTYLKGLHPAQWKGRPVVFCASGTCPTEPERHVTVYLNPDWNTIDLPGIHYHGKDGRLVARIENPDNAPVEQLALKTSNKVVYLWLGKMKGGRGFATYEVDMAANTVVLVSRAQKAGFCAGDQDDSDPVHAKPKDQCVRATWQTIYDITTPPTAKSVSSLTLISNPRGTNSVAALSPNEGLWFSCSGGCCQANSFF